MPKTQKIVLDADLFNTQYYMEQIKGKVEQSRERSSALLLHIGIVAIDKVAFRVTFDYVAKFTNSYLSIIAIDVVTYIYIYIYISVIFGRVKKFGVIPSGQENHSRAEHLNFPGRELNVIYFRAIFL